MSEPLEHFVEAQDPLWEGVEAELRAGEKQTHWMWFVFPQLEGLGSSEMAKRYALRSVAHARAYLAHPVLGPRLRSASALLLGHPGRTAEGMLGPVDAEKLRSCATLFRAAGSPPGQAEPFSEILRVFFGDVADPRTLQGLPADS